MVGLTPSLAEAWHALEVAFPEQPSLAEIPAACRAGRLALRQLKDSMKTQDGADWEDARRWVQGLEDTLDSDGMKAELLVNRF